MGPTGISHEFVRDALIAQGVPPAVAAAFPGIEHELVRDALAAKALGGPAAGTAAVAAAGKGVASQIGMSGGGGAANAVLTGGSVWGGKGMSLGLGIGLGLWGPILVGALGAAAIYAYLQYRQQAVDSEGETDPGFMSHSG